MTRRYEFRPEARRDLSSSMAMRDDAHRLIDALADQELPFAVKVLRSLRHRGQESAQSFKDLLLAIPCQDRS